jgi:hypothetical protein
MLPLNSEVHHLKQNIHSGLCHQNITSVFLCRCDLVVGLKLGLVGTSFCAAEIPAALASAEDLGAKSPLEIVPC